VKRLLTSPLPYLGWAFLVVAGLAITSFGDPYIFGFATFFLGAATIGVAVVALVAVVLPGGSWQRKVAILTAVAVAGAAIARALAILETFKWA
jgi:hypothetical protein